MLTLLQATCILKFFFAVQLRQRGVIAETYILQQNLTVRLLASSFAL